MDDDLKKFVIKGLSNGLAVDKLKPFLIDRGIPHEEVERKIIEILGKETGRLTRKTDRYETLLRTLDAQLRTKPDYLTPKRVKLPPFQQFLTEYYYPHKMGVFHSVIDHWEARNWTPRKLVEKVGEETLVQVQIGRDRSGRYEYNHEDHAREIRFIDFVNMIESNESTNDFYMTARNFTFNDRALEALKKDLGEDIGDGYLRSPARKNTLFLWMGPKGTVTPVHFDPSNHIYVHIYGTKTFRFFPAFQTPYLYNNERVDS